jgi:hypothetical protein
VKTIFTSYLYKADPEYGRRVGEAAGADVAAAAKLAATYED